MNTTTPIPTDWKTELEVLRARLDIVRPAHVPATPKQVALIVRAFEAVLDVRRDQRLEILRYIVQHGQPFQFKSTKELDRNEASELIAWLYGLGASDRWTKEAWINPHARAVLEGVRAALEPVFSTEKLDKFKKLLFQDTLD